MILAKARLIEDADDHVKVGLSFPTGFDPEEVIQESVVANGGVPPEAVRVDPRRGKLSDLYREFEVCFPAAALHNGSGAQRTLCITGRFRRGLRFSASVSGLSSPPAQDH